MGPRLLDTGAPPTPGTQGSRPASTPGVDAPSMLTPTRPGRPPATPTSISAPGRQRNRTGAGVRKGGARSARSGRRLPPAQRRERETDLEATLSTNKIEYYVPGDLEYERAVASSNLLYRFSRPTYVMRPSDTSEVQKIVTEAVARKLKITIKNGGHSYAGHSFPNDGIMLDLQKMNEVTFDKEARTMTVQGGALWGHVYRALVDDMGGFVVNGGRCPSVGVSGFLLGGGIGPFSRSFGMGSDNLIEVKIVTADGQVYTVRNDDDPDSDDGKLFWALCGAGGGNFGVVVELKVDVHALSNDQQEVVAGRYTWFPSIDRGRGGLFGFGRRDDGTGLLATMNHFYTTDWPEQMTIDSSWFSDLEQQNGEIGVRFLTYYDGKQESFNRLVAKGVLNADLARQITRRSLPEHSSRFLHETLFAQWDEETKRSTPANSTFRIFHSFCFKNDLHEITKITAIIKEELEAFKVLFNGETAGLCQVSWIHAGGQTTKKGRGASAFRWRETVYHTYIMTQWRDKWLERDMRGFAQKFKNRLKQFSLAGKAAFVNFPDASIPETDHLKAYYGNNRQKLQQVKRLWDERNYFKWDQGIDFPSSDAQDFRDDAEMNTRNYEAELSDGPEEGADAQTDMLATMRWEGRDTSAAAPLLTLAFEALGLDYGMFGPDRPIARAGNVIGR